MMICIEGADRSGKSTLFAALSRALPDFKRMQRTRGISFDIPKECIPHIEVAYLDLFSQLYDERVDYLFDRSPTLSAEVYSRVANRRLIIDPAPWRAQQRIVYLVTPQRVMTERWRKSPKTLRPEDYSTVLAEYERVLPLYPNVIKLDGTRDVDELVMEVRRAYR